MPRHFRFSGAFIKIRERSGRNTKIKKMYPLISAITGEIGNNSFDHNLGNWPDAPGTFFAYNLNKRQIVLADRGQGVLVTLKRARPGLSDHKNALRVAFTEIVSGRAPEYRGNGLKFVSNVVIDNKISLFFQTGDAQLRIQKDDSVLSIKKNKRLFAGVVWS